jgi:hypothetical protein
MLQAAKSAKFIKLSVLSPFPPSHGVYLYSAWCCRKKQNAKERPVAATGAQKKK